MFCGVFVARLHHFSDFDSKLAFSIVQILLSLTQTTNASGAVITIPAG